MNFCRGSSSGSDREDGAAALGGLGLGLAIARHEFTVALPIGNAPLGALRPATDTGIPATSHDGTPLRNVRVLVVDDDADVREFLVTVLRHHGADATGAGSALEAVGAISRRKPDVLVSDINMPGEDGYALLQRLHALPPELGGTVPALSLSAYEAPDDAARALAAGFQLHLGKPVPPATLVSAVAVLAGKPPAGQVNDGHQTDTLSSI